MVIQQNSRISLILPLATLLAIAVNGCAKATDIATGAEDSSASGVAASSVGGSLSSSSSSGAMARNSLPSTRGGTSALLNAFLPEAIAGNACPSLKSAAGAGCTNGSSVVTLALNGCSFGSAASTWSGNLQMGAAGISCGSFPSVSNGNLTRQFVDGSGNPGSGSRTSALGTVVTIDHKTANLGNFNNDTIPANIGSGYGTAITFSGGTRSQVQVRQHISSAAFDNSVLGNLTISESGGVRTATQNLTVYHNKLKVIGTSVFNNVVFNDTCCQPVSGSITTTFASTGLSGAVGQALNGKSETMTFTSCGAATLTGTDGSTANVALSHCL